ncbi:hypothetical protein ACU686_06070 [Yinghuangia aomiensis]
MHLRRSFRAATAAVAGSLAVVGAVVVGAPAAHATELTWTSKCVNQIVPDPADPAVGDQGRCDRVPGQGRVQRR